MFWRKKKKTESNETGQLTWDPQAEAALSQAIAQAPVPGVLKNRVRSEMKKAAEAAARTNNRTTVTVEDVMAGLLSKVPDHMRSQIEEAMKSKDPAQLKKLEQQLKQKGTP